MRHGKGGPGADQHQQLLIPDGATCEQLATAQQELLRALDPHVRRHTTNISRFHPPLPRTIFIKIYPSKMSTLVCPSCIWTMLLILFTTTFANPQTDTAATTTAQDVGPLVSAIAAAGTLGTHTTQITTGPT